MADEDGNGEGGKANGKAMAPWRRRDEGRATASLQHSTRYCLSSINFLHDYT